MIKKINKGFALIEVLIAVTIISGSMLTVVSVANKSITYAQNSLKDYQATLAMEETIEAVKSIRAADWNNISNLTDGQNYGLDFVNTNYTTIQNPTENKVNTMVFYNSLLNKQAIHQHSLHLTIELKKLTFVLMLRAKVKHQLMLAIP